jgi:hypothetical protein
MYIAHIHTIQCVRGGGSYGVLGLRQINKCHKVLYRSIFLLSIQLISLMVHSQSVPFKTYKSSKRCFLSPLRRERAFSMYSHIRRKVLFSFDFFYIPIPLLFYITAVFIPCCRQYTNKYYKHNEPGVYRYVCCVQCNYPLNTVTVLSKDKIILLIFWL